MRTIIIEDSIYKVTEREFKVIQKMEEQAKKDAAMGQMPMFHAMDYMDDYLEVAKTSYKFIGTVDFMIRR